MGIRRTLTGIAAFAVACAGVVAAAPAASAVPACVKIEPIYQTFDIGVEITNTCSYDVRLKVLYAFAPDTECKNVQSGYVWITKRARPARFDGVVDCA